MNDVHELDDDNLPAEELFMSGLFRARLPLSEGEWGEVLTVAEVSLDALYQPQVRFMCWAADESDEEPTWLHLSSIVMRDDQVRLYEDVRLDGPPLLAKSWTLGEDDDNFDDIYGQAELGWTVFVGMVAEDLGFAVVDEAEVSELVESQSAFADAVETFGYAAASTVLGPEAA